MPELGYCGSADRTDFAWEVSELGALYKLDSRLLILNPDSDECKRSGLCETHNKEILEGELRPIAPGAVNL